MAAAPPSQPTRPAVPRARLQYVATDGTCKTCLGREGPCLVTDTLGCNPDGSCQKCHRNAVRIKGQCRFVSGSPCLVLSYARRLGWRQRTRSGPARATPQCACSAPCCSPLTTAASRTRCPMAPARSATWATCAWRVAQSASGCVVLGGWAARRGTAHGGGASQASRQQGRGATRLSSAPPRTLLSHLFAVPRRLHTMPGQRHLHQVR